MPIFSCTGHILQDLFGKTDNWGQTYIVQRSSFFMHQTICLQYNVKEKKIIAM